uniref:Uncharacterized protein n=1 Tax=Rhizophora mucronata TaxID=61149 RepID=A0A2P2KBW8_RHIMU
MKGIHPNLSAAHSFNVSNPLFSSRSVLVLHASQAQDLMAVCSHQFAHALMHESEETNTSQSHGNNLSLKPAR